MSEDEATQFFIGLEEVEDAKNKEWNKAHSSPISTGTTAFE